MAADALIAALGIESEAVREYDTWAEAHPAIYPSSILMQDKADAAIESLLDEVALRDRMLRDIIERIALTPERWNGWTTEEVLADLRARAEKEAER